ncbi:universal stress protein [Pelagibacterium halotolerans]|uniref:universal stress protein n=1 Tax=Pelagibacterium halotolerans TaxID=531813 RepID=UPI00384FC887
MKKIVAGLDGSAHGEAVVAAAADLAKTYAASLTLVHVAEKRRFGEAEWHYGEADMPVHTSRFGARMIEEMPDWYTDINSQEALRRYDLQSAAIEEAVGESVLAHGRDIAEGAGISEIASELRYGDPAQEILEVVDDVGADLIVLGRRGMNRFAELLLGSVSQKVLHHTRTNVLLVATDARD